MFEDLFEDVGKTITDLSSKIDLPDEWDTGEEMWSTGRELWSTIERNPCAD